MNRKIYIASSLYNAEKVQQVRDLLVARGVQVTYDWTIHGFVQDETLSEIAANELGGVLDAECVLAIMPGRNGCHFEMGAAFARRIPIVLLIENHDHVWTSFHKRPEIRICRTVDEAIEAALVFEPYKTHFMDKYA
jgi:nucleoside 2-deoxyribosyltransferase